MIVKNLTSEVKEIEVRERTSSRTYTCYIEPFGQTDIEKMILATAAPEGVELVGACNPTPVPICDIPPVPSVTEVSEEEKKEEPKEEKEEPETPPSNEDKFICDECGAEFASARSLASHKSRSHSK